MHGRLSDGRTDVDWRTVGSCSFVYLVNRVTWERLTIIRALRSGSFAFSLQELFNCFQSVEHFYLGLVW